VIHFYFWKFPGYLLLAALLLGGCGVTGPDLRQEVQDEARGTREHMSPLEKSYESHKYFGYSSQDPGQWNPTDWNLYMDSQGGSP
jgi:outer membrane biogenesis lipoprotein LolB